MQYEIQLDIDVGGKLGQESKLCLKMKAREDAHPVLLW